jgi:hypothetical protein
MDGQTDDCQVAIDETKEMGGKTLGGIFEGKEW